MNFDLQLANRRALVTGGTKGVGAAVVELSVMPEHRSWLRRAPRVLNRPTRALPCR